MTGDRCPDCGREVDGVCAHCHFATGSWVPQRQELSGLPDPDAHTFKKKGMNYHQDQDQDQGTTTSPSYEPPGPGGISEPGLLEIALEECKRGNLTPVAVELGPMPARAGDVMKAVAEHVRFLMGLRLAMGEDRPLPYATSMAVRAGVAPDKGTASHAIRALVKFGVIEHVGNLPPLRPGIDGTKLYSPPATATIIDLRDRREAA